MAQNDCHGEINKIIILLTLSKRRHFRGCVTTIDICHIHIWVPCKAWPLHVGFHEKSTGDDGKLI